MFKQASKFSASLPVLEVGERGAYAHDEEQTRSNLYPFADVARLA
jgi:hypothetical protein